MPRGRSYRKQKQALIRIQTELAYHRLAKARGEMIREQQKRYFMLEHRTARDFLFERFHHEVDVEIDKLEFDIRSWDIMRLKRERAFNQWQREALAEKEDMMRGR